MNQINKKNLSTTRIALDLNKLIEASHSFPRNNENFPRKRSLEQAEK